MKVGLISDTHISQEGEKIPSGVFNVFDGVDLILHGGDIYLLSLLDELKSIAPVMAVRGNGDPRLSTTFFLKDSLVLDLNGVHLGLSHGLDHPEPYWRPLEAAMQHEFGGKVDIFVFGDTHMALAEVYKGVVLINPGSPTLPRGIKSPGTVALLKIDPNREIGVEIISLATGVAIQRLEHYF